MNYSKERNALSSIEEADEEEGEANPTGGN